MANSSENKEARTQVGILDALQKFRLNSRGKRTGLSKGIASISGQWAKFRAFANRGPWLTIFASVAPIIAGLCASVDPGGIKNTTFVLLSDQPIAPVVTLFWTAVIATGLSFGLSQSEQSATTKSLVEVVRRLQTLPPTGYVQNYRDQYRAVLNPVLAVVLSPRPVGVSAIEDAIRTLLGAILEVARDYDVAQQANYGANIMMWRSLNQGFEQASTQPLVRLVMSQPPARGHLELVCQLSTSTSSTNYQPDPQVPPIVIPVPIDCSLVRDPKGHSRNPVLPGAAQAFVNRSIVAYESIDEIFQWLDDEFAADPAVVLDVKAYFDGNQATHVRSFASLPVMQPTSPDAVIAVLNLHSDREGILHDNGQTLFAPLLEPFLTLLAILLVKREAGLSTPQSAPPPPSAPLGATS